MKRRGRFFFTGGQTFVSDFRSRPFGTEPPFPLRPCRGERQTPMHRGPPVPSPPSLSRCVGRRGWGEGARRGRRPSSRVHRGRQAAPATQALRCGVHQWGHSRAGNARVQLVGAVSRSRLIRSSLRQSGCVQKPGRDRRSNSGSAGLHAGTSHLTTCSGRRTPQTIRRFRM